MHEWFVGKEKIPKFKECPYCKKGITGLYQLETVEYMCNYYVGLVCKECKKKFYVKLNSVIEGKCMKLL